MIRLNQTRRQFSKSLLMGSALCVVDCLPFLGRGDNKKTSIALQLYTVRDLLQDDFAGTVKKVAELGYDAVEFAGYDGLKAGEVKKLLDALGLQCAGTHEGFEKLQSDLDQVIDFNLGIGNKLIICPAMPAEYRKKGADGFKAFGEKLNTFGEKVTKAGMHFGYHNHDFEFKTAGDKLLIDVLFGAADPELVKAQVDVYWVKRGGQDPAAFIRDHGKRVVSLHLKDVANDEEQSFAPVGTGLLDFPAIIRAARSVGVEWFVVEQDKTRGSVWEDIETSLKNTRKLLSA
jgi:sugar phosphate isomerase/epimerase